MLIIQTRMILLTLLVGCVSVQSKPSLTDETYAKYVCQKHQDGARILVPGTCTQYFECKSGQSSVKSCNSPTKYFDSSSGECTATSTCIEPHGDCSTPEPKPTTPNPCKTTPSVRPTTPTTPTVPSESTTTSTTLTTPKTTTPQTPCQVKANEEERKMQEKLAEEFEEFFKGSGQRCDSPGGSCRGLKNGVLIPYKGVCNKYIACFGGCGAEIFCPDGLHFNVRTGLCDRSDTAGCDF